MSVGTLVLAASGCLLLAVAMGSCWVLVEVEPQTPPVVTASFLVGFLGGGGSLALAAFRLWHGGARNAWPDVAQSTVLFFVGLGIVFGSLACLYVLAQTRLGYGLLAVFFAGIAFTVGATLLLFRAVRADSRG